MSINYRFRISKESQSNYLVYAHLFPNQKFYISIKPSCKDGRKIIATNCRVSRLTGTDRDGPERTGTDRNGLSWIPKRTFWVPKRTLMNTETDRDGPERTETDRNGLSWIPKRTFWVPKRTLVDTETDSLG